MTSEVPIGSQEAGQPFGRTGVDIVSPEKTIIIHKKTRRSVERYQKHIDKAFAAMKRAEKRNEEDARIDQETLDIRINK